VASGGGKKEKVKVKVTPKKVKLQDMEVGDVTMWDATSGQKTLTLNGHTRYVTSVAFSPDGKRLASSAGAEVKVWDVTPRP